MTGKRIVFNGREVIVREHSRGRYIERSEYRQRRADVVRGMRIAGRSDAEIAELLGMPKARIPRIVGE